MRLFFAISILFLSVTGQKIVDLGEIQWSVSNGDNVTKVPAKFPSQAHLDLYAAGIIDDPLYGFNDVDQLWVQRANWTYSSGPIPGM